MNLTDQQIIDLERADLITREAKAFYDNARHAREAEIRRIAAAGATYREIAEVAGVAYQRVAQIVTGKNAPYRDVRDHLRFECPKCGAGVDEACEGKTLAYAHIERHEAAYKAFAAAHPELG